jgi:predicted phage tail protein
VGKHLLAQRRKGAKKTAKKILRNAVALCAFAPLRESSSRKDVLFVQMCLCVFVVLASGCGKRRPPLPPVERVQQRTEFLSGAQQGNEVILSWPAPRRNAPDSSVQSIRRIDVYRLAEKPGAPVALTEDEFSARATLVGSVTYEQIQTAGDTVTYRDVLELAGQPTRLRYALRYVNASGQRAAFSNFLSIEPAARIAQAPTLTAPPKVAEDSITISWQAPAANIDGSTPVNLLGYNVYRVDESQTELGNQAINSALISGTEYADKNFQFGKDYRYIVRAVSLGTGGSQVESLNSNTVSVSPRDIFPPAAPERPSVAAPEPSSARLAIFFAANKETDIAGYNIYRSTDPDLPKANWTKLNQALLTRTTYQDDKVETGKTYYYYVTAVDKAGNVSPPSEVGSEKAP